MTCNLGIATPLTIRTTRSTFSSNTNHEHEAFIRTKYQMYMYQMLCGYNIKSTSSSRINVECQEPVHQN